jgi:hypothetical protein
MAALTMATTAYSVKTQNDQAEAASESAKNTAVADYMAVEDARGQVNTQANAEALKLKRQALIERGRIVAGQSEAGFFGNSPLRELWNNRLKEREALGTNVFNQGNALMQNTRDAGSIFATATGRANEARASRIGNLAAGLQIAGAGVEGVTQGYSMYNAIYKPKRVQ